MYSGTVFTRVRGEHSTWAKPVTKIKNEAVTPYFNM